MAARRKPPDDVTIRVLVEGDLPFLQTLLHQLGYEVEPGQIASRFVTLASSDGHAMFVAQGNNGVVGFLHVYGRASMESPPSAVVQAVVVDETCRNAGVGEALMQRAEAWAERHGYAQVALSSNIVRENAHHFYRRLGYEIAATSHAFRKRISGRPQGGS